MISAKGTSRFHVIGFSAPQEALQGHSVPEVHYDFRLVRLINGHELSQHAVVLRQYMSRETHVSLRVQHALNRIVG
jgi:hypothetical protein